MYKRPELLSPAGDGERLRYAVCYGADAVYCGLQDFGMRSACANFDPAQLEEGCIYAHARGKRVYLTLNTLPTNEEMDRLPAAIRDAVAAGVDAFIVTDLGVLAAVKKYAPDTIKAVSGAFLAQKSACTCRVLGRVAVFGGV